MNGSERPDYSLLVRQRNAAASETLDATRLSLLARLKNHADQDGWQRFFDTYGGLILALAIKAGLPPSDADEVVQETLISVAAEMPDFQYDPARGSFKGWLFRIARRRIADHFRKTARRQRRLESELEDVGELGELLDPAADPLSGLWDEEWRRHRLQRTIEVVKKRVSPAQWQMFDLTVAQEQPVSAVCQLLGVNRAQIYMAKMRVGRLIKEELLRLGEF